MEDQLKTRYVDHLPDLMSWDDYEVVDQKKTVKIRITVTDDGLEILGDSPYPHLLEQLLQELDPEVIEMMLCG
jgi:hypothetical protein